MATIQNFECIEQQPLSVTSTSGNVHFTNAKSEGAPDCMVANYGTKGCQVVFGSSSSTTAVATSSAAGTNQVYIPAGAIMVVRKSGSTYAAAICDGSDSTTIAFHTGTGQ